jgi:hypothetical protein
MCLTISRKAAIRFHMNGLPPNPSPLTIAKESLAMSEKTGDKAFMKIALGLMALTGLATLIHACHAIYRDLKPKCDYDRSARAYPPPRLVESGEEQPRRDDGPDSSWVRKARVSDRPAEGEKVWAERHSHQDSARQH